MKPSTAPSAQPVHRVGQFAFRFPSPGQDLDQDHEWCEIKVEGDWRRIRFHDYDQIYSVPGLYEMLFYQWLKCTSPARVVGLLAEVMADFPQNADELRVLELGAGNGMVGHELRSIGVPYILGADIIAQAKAAADRDRPGVYDRYLVADITDISESQEAEIRQARLNCLVTVAALGFGDIPPEAFLAAYRMLDSPGWLAFNIKEDFLNEDADPTGFSGLVRRMRRHGLIQIQAYRRYCHRLSVHGEPLYYVAIVATKNEELPVGWWRPKRNQIAFGDPSSFTGIGE